MKVKTLIEKILIGTIPLLFTASGILAIRNDIKSDTVSCGYVRLYDKDRDGKCDLAVGYLLGNRLLWKLPRNPTEQEKRYFEEKI